MRVSLAVVLAVAVFAVAAPARSSTASGRPAVHRQNVTIQEIEVPGDPNQFTDDAQNDLWFGASTNATKNLGFLGELDPKTGQVTTYDIPYGGVTDDEPSHPHLGTDGNMYYIADANGTYPAVLGRVTPSGTLTVYEKDVVAQSLDVSSDGKIVSNGAPDGATIALMNEGGTGYHTFNVPVPPGYSTADGFGPKFGPGGNLWCCQTISYPSAGGLGASTIRATLVANVVLGGGRCSEVAYGPDGNLWTASPATGELVQVTPEGKVTYYAKAQFVTQPRPDTVDGSIWFVSASGSQTSIDELVIATKKLTAYPVPALPSGDSIRDLEVDHPNNAVWFSEAGSKPVDDIFRLVLN